MNQSQSSGSFRPVLGAALGLAVAAIMARTLWLATSDQWHALTGPATPDPADALLLACAAIATLAAVWLGLSAGLAFLGHVPGAVGQAAHAASARVTPLVVRRTVSLLLGSTLVAAAAPGTAVAASPPATAGTTLNAAGVSTRHTLVVDGGPDRDPHFVAVERAAPLSLDPRFAPTPARSASFGATPPSTASPTPAASVATGQGAPPYVVRAGDSLWAIAARELPRDASNAQIARRWQEWYAVNRAVIGASPDHLEIGQRLSAPETVAAS